MNTSPEIPLDDRLRWVQSVSKLLDNQFTFPGTNFKFGLDPIIGLLPVVGGMSTMAMSGVLVMTMARHGASRYLIMRMLFNVVLDTVIGMIPVLGWIFDFTYKANQRNVELLRRHYQHGQYQGKGTGFLMAVLLGFLVLFGLIFYGIWKASEYIWTYFSSMW
ncbi:DUF4112 domain-containing protein [Rufibacter sp. LB8]|uniref:DUF4112 domain-containing protein n=1 Tax=Rufibacter sp. LB8 TaxID=2777781 RepID=UPI00178C7BD1|nr:DUF4112 domain-containing protein [Rufibacter sp. LB8]